ncbi:MAG: RNA polymerase sigma-54 factor [Alphaproteobacteria bacterium]|nr:RNA polymerase sigma-54 factor [Alphaproteobacteria bacterium]
MAARGVSLSPQLKSAQRQRLAMTPSLRMSLQVLSMRISGVRRLAWELAQDNPFLDVTLPELPSASPAGGKAVDFDHFAHAAVHPIPLSQHVMDQIGLIIRNPDDAAVAYALSDHLSPAGWLDDGAIDQLMADGITRSKAEEVLALLQTMEPAGLFARNLSECLALQLKDRGQLTAQATAVLAHLDAMAQGVAHLATASGLDVEDAAAVLDLLKRCDPKPGAGFRDDDGDVFRPDLIISPSGGGYDVTVNAALMPSLSVTPCAMPEEGDEAGALLLKQARAEVQALQRSIQHRHENLLAAGAILIDRQMAYLKQGEAGVAPFTMSGLAEIMGVHKSTVSRLVEDKLVQTPRGMVAMSAFFSPGVKQPDGRVIASRAIVARIRAHIDAMIAADDQPMPDALLVKKLAHDGIIVARRTVAKYRAAIGVSPRQRRNSAVQQG